MLFLLFLLFFVFWVFVVCGLWFVFCCQCGVHVMSVGVRGVMCVCVCVVCDVCYVLSVCVVCFFLFLCVFLIDWMCLFVGILTCMVPTRIPTVLQLCLKIKNTYWEDKYDFIYKSMSYNFAFAILDLLAFLFSCFVLFWAWFWVSYLCVFLYYVGLIVKTKTHICLCVFFIYVNSISDSIFISHIFFIPRLENL